jgi:acetyl/propionyl-CoA carboxylase alpha subunit
VRVDTFIESGTVISPFYDSMVAKLAVWDIDRDRAIARAERALRETEVVGVPTTRDLALEVLASEPFRSGDYSTSTLEELRRRLDGADQVAEAAAWPAPERG